MEWHKQEIGKELVNEIMHKYGCDALSASILVRRGVIEGKDILFYLENDLRYLHSPFLFKNMEDAVDRILDAKEEGEKVLIFGDRDVDGITSVTLLHEALVSLGMDVTWKIPSGDESYGLSMEAVEEHAEKGGTLIITVDCGISNFKEIEAANEKGIDVIIIDHHTPQDKVPNAVVIINPRMPDCEYPNKELSGCAAAWKVVTALRIGMMSLYKQQICLLNIRPLNDAYMIEAVKLVNMTETARLTETVVPGVVSFSQTRLGGFLHGQMIYVWDAPLQKKMAEAAFGNGIEFNFFDFQPELAKVFPKQASLSLLRLKEMSRMGKYSGKPVNEIDVFVNIFITFLQYTNKIFGKNEMEELQLVTLSTLADLMELTGENRMIAKLGLQEINKAPRLGLSDLMAMQNLTSMPIGTETIAWNISPLINATGRMGSPETAIELFLAKDSTERTEKAKAIFAMNEERKRLGAKGWETALPLAYKSFEEFNERLVIAVSENFHRGITGILAGKLAEFFKVPSVVICPMEGGKAAASLRSARGYRLLSILEPFAHMFSDYGGHAFAAGFGIANEKIPELLEALKRYTFSMEFDKGSDTEILNVDAELPPKYLTPSILDIVDKFEPYGPASPQLLFVSKKIKILNASLIGKTEPFHLKMTLQAGSYKWSAVYWKAGDKLNIQFKEGDVIDIVYSIERNIFNGSVTPQITIKDMCLSCTNPPA